MARTIQWNARGNTLLTAQERQAVESAANINRSGRSNDRSIALQPATPTRVDINGTNVEVNGEVVGTLNGTPDGFAKEP